MTDFEALLDDLTQLEIAAALLLTLIEAELDEPQDHAREAKDEPQLAVTA